MAVVRALVAGARRRLPRSLGARRPRSRTTCFRRRTSQSVASAPSSRSVACALDAATRASTRRSTRRSSCALPGGHLQRLGHVHAARAEAAWLVGDTERALVEARAAYPLAVEKRHLWFAGELAYWQWKADALEGLAGLGCGAVSPAARGRLRAPRRTRGTPTAARTRRPARSPSRRAGSAARGPRGLRAPRSRPRAPEPPVSACVSSALPCRAGRVRPPARTRGA